MSFIFKNLEEYNRKRYENLSREKLIEEIKDLKNKNSDFKATKCRATWTLIISITLLLFQLIKWIIELRLLSQ